MEKNKEFVQKEILLVVSFQSESCSICNDSVYEEDTVYLLLDDKGELVWACSSCGRNLQVLGLIPPEVPLHKIILSHVQGVIKDASRSKTN
jgi:hypothetical protein